MSYTDDEKLGFCKAQIMNFILSIKTWADFKNFISSINKTQLKNKLKSAYQSSLAESDNSIVQHEAKKINDAEMESEIEGL